MNSTKITFKLSALDRIHLVGKQELMNLAEFYDIEGYEDMDRGMLREALEELKSEFNEDSYRK